jgi:hypothetical protein
MFLTTPLSYAVGAWHFGHCARLLRDVKLASSSLREAQLLAKSANMAARRG